MVVSTSFQELFEARRWPYKCLQVYGDYGSSAPFAFIWCHLKSKFDSVMEICVVVSGVNTAYHYLGGCVSTYGVLVVVVCILW